MTFKRYWIAKETPTGFSETFLDNVRSAIELSGVSICDGAGTDEPIITSKMIHINGDQSRGEDRDSFALRSDLTWTPEEGEPQFCATDKQPYDVVVKAILRLAKRYGYIENWLEETEHHMEDEANALFSNALNHSRRT